MRWNPRTQAAVLAAGLVVWGGALYWRMTQPASAPAAAPGEARRRAQASVEKRSGTGRKGPGAAAAPPALRLDLLDRPLPALTGGGKNLFASVLPPPPPPPSKPGPAVAAPPPPDPFLEEARRLRLVAVMQEDGQVVAFIADGNDVHSVKKNDVIRSRFLIKDVTEEWVVVSQPDGDKEVRLGLTPSAGGAKK